MYKTPLKLKLKVGALHSALGIPPAKKIPETSLDKALGSQSPLMKKRAQFAKNAATWKK